MKAIQWRLTLAVVLVLLLTLAACAGEDEEADQADEAPSGTPVRVTTIETTTVEETERSVGTVETFTRPVVAAEVAGRIQHVAKDVGDRVEAGEVLARIEAEPFEIGRDVAEAEVGRLEAQVQRLQLDLQRLKRLSEREYATEQDEDALQAELAGAREQLNSARARLRQAERDLRLTDILAPVAGVVDERMVSEGGFVGAGNPAFRIQPQDRFRALVSFPSRVGDRLDIGMMVRLRPGGGQQGEVEGEITRLRPAVDSATRAVGVIVEFDNPGGWRPGMTVEARVVLSRRENALRVPDISLVRRPAGNVIYVLDGDSVEERPVDVGVRTAEWVEILSGAEAGERVVTEGAPFLTDGANIRVREAS